MTDSSGRESDVSNVTITTNNPGPTITGTSDSGDSQNWPSVSLIAKPTPGFKVTSWCLSQQTDSNIDVFPVFTDSNGEELDEDSYEYSDGCYTPNYESRQVKFSLVPSKAKNGKYAFEFWAYDENNHASEKYKYVYTVQDPGLKIGLPDSGTLYLPGDFPYVELNSQGGYRTVESIQWSIDGKTIPGSAQQLNANLSEVSPGAHTVSVKVIDSVGQSYSASKSYTMKWAPELKFVGVEGAYWWTPATPMIKIKAYLGDSAWAGSHKATISYRNSSGKAVKQTFTIKNGVGSVVLQTLKSTTSIEVSVEATKGTVAASAETTIVLKKKPPTPVYTKISLSIPSLVIWPNSFKATVRVSGKGSYECNLYFQSYKTTFYVNSGSSKTVTVEPTEGLNKAQTVSGTCTSKYSTGWFSDWLKVSLQR